jgi:hypothetical protein
MFLYILNLLNDGLKKKKNLCECSNFEIINDTHYISQLAGIKRNFDIKIIAEKIVDIFEVLSRYNLTVQDSVSVFNKLLKNNNNLWILECFYNGDNNIKEEPESVLNSIVINIIENIYTRRIVEKLGNAV